MNRLLILACSATKSSAPGYLPARQRYTGPVWQTLKAADPDGRLAHVSALSALYGWVDGEYPLSAYNVQMTAARKAEVVFYQTVFAQTHVTVEIALSRATRVDGLRAARPLTEVCVVGGRLYQETAEPLLAHARTSSPQYFAPDLSVVTICDQIGLMRQRLRAWLAAGEVTT